MARLKSLNLTPNCATWWLAKVLIMVLAIILLGRFRHQPGKLFVSGLTAWTFLTITYLAAELHFSLLGSRMGAFHVFHAGRGRPTGLMRCSGLGLANVLRG